MAPTMPCKHMRKCRSDGSNKIKKQNLCVFWKLMNPRECVWKIRYRIIIRRYCRKRWRKSVWNLTKVRNKLEVIDEARTLDATVHFGSLMDIYHLKNAELEAKPKKCKGRVVLRSDIVKDNSGSYAVFTEQGSSASQMTAAKIMDIISRLPDCDGEAADAISAYTQVKMEDAHKLLKIPNRNVHTFGFVCHDTNGPIHGPVWKIQSFLLKGICTVILCRTIVGKAI